MKHGEITTTEKKRKCEKNVFPAGSPRVEESRPQTLRMNSFGQSRLGGDHCYSMKCIPLSTKWFAAAFFPFRGFCCRAPLSGGKRAPAACGEWCETWGMGAGRVDGGAMDGLHTLMTTLSQKSWSCGIGSKCAGCAWNPVPAPPSSSWLLSLGNDLWGQN